MGRAVTSWSLGGVMVSTLDVGSIPALSVIFSNYVEPMVASTIIQCTACTGSCTPHRLPDVTTMQLIVPEVIADCYIFNCSH